MKIFLAVTLLCTLGVSSAASTVDVTSILNSALGGVSQTLDNTLNELSCNLDTINTTIDQITTTAKDGTTNAVNELVTNSINTVTKVTGLDPDVIQKNCTKMNDDKQSLVNEALTDLENDAKASVSDVSNTVQDVINLGKSIQDQIANLATQAASCVSPLATVSVFSCVSDLVKDIPDAVEDFSSKALSASVQVATLDVSTLAKNSEAKAVVAILGDTCTILSDLGNCAANLLGNNN